MRVHEFRVFRVQELRVVLLDELLFRLLRVSKTRGLVGGGGFRFRVPFKAASTQSLEPSEPNIP